MTDGAPLTMRVAIKPTPSIAATQKTVNKEFEEIDIEITGRHDPVIVPRAVVVVEAMAAITILDALLENMKSKFSDVVDFYS
jgi:chorismate synthase